MGSHVCGLVTAYEKWKYFENVYPSDSSSRIMELKGEMQSMMKENITINEYVEKLKDLSAQLISIGENVPNKELIRHLLNGLGPDFNACICSINNHTDEVSIEEAHSQLLSYERLLEHQNKMITRTKASNQSCWWN